MAKSVQGSYVAAARGARSAAAKVGLLKRLESSDRHWAQHARTLFAIHDVDDLASLDYPWWVYEAIDRADAFLESRGGKARVFEYGSGASTMWLARRSAEVYSVEHHDGFSALMTRKVADLPHVSLRHVPPAIVTAGVPATPSQRKGHENMDFTDYVHAIDAVDGEFDLIVVDGRAREACLAHAAPRLVHDGLLVFDNCNRKRYHEALDASGMNVEIIRGAAPCLPYRAATALLTNK